MNKTTNPHNPEPSVVLVSLQDGFQVMETVWSMQMIRLKSHSMQSRQDSRHLRDGLESQEMVQWNGYQLEAHWFYCISLKICLFICTGQ